MDFYMAMIVQFAGNFAPRNFMYCNGQIISIAQNTALFSLLGTTFGGNPLAMRAGVETLRIMTEDGLLMEGVTSKDSFGDALWHIEFRLPYQPAAEAHFAAALARPRRVRGRSRSMFRTSTATT